MNLRARIHKLEVHIILNLSIKIPASCGSLKGMNSLKEIQIFTIFLSIIIYMFTDREIAVDLFPSSSRHIKHLFISHEIIIS
jgi:hypothetical protein